MERRGSVPTNANTRQKRVRCFRLLHVYLRCIPQIAFRSDLCANQAKSGYTRPNLANPRPILPKLRRNRSFPGHMCLGSTEFGPSSTDLMPNSTTFGQSRPGIGQIWPEVDHLRPMIAGSCPLFAQNEPSGARKWTAHPSALVLTSWALVWASGARALEEREASRMPVSMTVPTWFGACARPLRQQQIEPPCVQFLFRARRHGGPGFVLTCREVPHACRAPCHVKRPRDHSCARSCERLRL